MQTCPLCFQHTALDQRNSATVASNVKRWALESFHIWRCDHCQSIHLLESPDLDKYYCDYPFAKRRLDFFARRIFSSYLKNLKPHKLHHESRILDYGCGSGVFVEYLREQGYTHVSGYDPFSEKFNDSSVLTEKYDFIFAQDVIEHSPQPLSFMKQLTDLLKTDGILVLGTPRSDNIDFASIEDSHHQIHAPFHLHIFSEKQLVKVAEAAALKVERVRPFNPTNTWLPFLNWSFLESYMATKGNFIDSALEAPDLKQIFFSPRLLLKGLFGFWIGRSQPDMLLIARKADRLSR